MLAFLVIGYLLYTAMWIPIGRFQFIYYYMPALYLGFLALAAMLAECWEGATRKWEEGALLIAASPALVLGLGTMAGAAAIAAIAIAYGVLLRIREKDTGMMVCALYLGGALILFVYFFPLCVGLPLTPDQFNARMWLRGTRPSQLALASDRAMMVDGGVRSHLSRLALLLSLLVTLVLGNCGSVFSADQAPSNGDLIEGSGDAPTDWRRISQRHLDPSVAAETFTWAHPSGSPSELRLFSRKRNLIHWDRTLNLAPGWYYLNGELRTAGLGDRDVALMAVQLPKNDFSVTSASGASPSDWSKGALYLKVGRGGRRIIISCKLEGRGTASFRSINLVEASSPPPASVIQINLDEYPEEHPLQEPHPYGAPSGQPWTLIATIIVMMVAVVGGWIGLDPRWKR